jgi:hypothetical protein
MVNDPLNTVWIGLEYFCNENDRLWNMNREDFIDFAIAELVKIKIIEKEDVLDATQVKIRKAYPAYLGSYSEIDGIRAYLDTISNLYYLGRNGQHKYNNMDHSMLTAMEAVKLIKTGDSDKSAVWNVNTEEEYHEENSIKELAIISIMLISVCFGYFCFYNNVFTGHEAQDTHIWLSASTVKFVNNWLQEWPLKLHFIMYEYPDSIEFNSLAERGAYISYPPGAMVPIYWQNCFTKPKFRLVLLNNP